MLILVFKSTSIKLQFNHDWVKSENDYKMTKVEKF